MKWTFTFLAVLGLPGAASATSIEGRWANPKGSVIVDVQRCGSAYCGTVQHATHKARDSARKGGTPAIIGTQVLTGLTAQGNGTFRGRAFDPKRNIEVPATVRQVDSNTLFVKGCAAAGLVCKHQLWKRVSG